MAYFTGNLSSTYASAKDICTQWEELDIVPDDNTSVIKNFSRMLCFNTFSIIEIHTVATMCETCDHVEWVLPVKSGGEPGVPVLLERLAGDVERTFHNGFATISHDIIKIVNIGSFLKDKTYSIRFQIII